MFNSYTRPLEPPHPVRGRGSVNDPQSGPSVGSESSFHDSNRTLNERIIMEALENRPYLMKNMDRGARDKRQMTFEEHYWSQQQQQQQQQQPSRHIGRRGRDNLGYEDDLYQQQQQQQQGQMMRQSNVQMAPSPYSNDYRRVYRDEADFYLHEREAALKRKRREDYVEKYN